KGTSGDALNGFFAAFRVVPEMLEVQTPSKLVDRQSSNLQIVFSVGPGAKLRDRNGHLTDMWADFTRTFRCPI
ncbi:MAG: hypothetical protein P8M20_07845, partial [Planctomycetaceae bacterium]|nr:hypothetical protein [Planctomycetaceae bacterium]